MRRYNRWWSRFDQPDPWDGSYNLGDPQSFNRYAYVQNDPVNFVDPSGLNVEMGGGGWSCTVSWAAELLPDGKISNFRYTSINCQTWGSSNGSVRGGSASQQHDDLKKEFYDQYQKKLARCIWQIFGTDLNGNPANTSQIMARQSFRNAPDVDMSRTVGQLGFRGTTVPDRGRYGTLIIASDLQGRRTQSGQTISAREEWHRVYAHELGNVLSSRYTGNGWTHGTREGIIGDVSGWIKDYDTGARLEKCIFGNTSH
jgi:hypothetical protein